MVTVALALAVLKREKCLMEGRALIGVLIGVKSMSVMREVD